MPTVVVVPVRSFRFGKKRLSASLDEPARTRLGKSLTERVVTAATEAGAIPIVVTGDDDVGYWAVEQGFPVVADSGTGLDGAARAGAGWANAAGSPWLIVHSDLPLLTAKDVRVLVGSINEGRWPIAPSSDGGTSAIGGNGEFAFSYGPASFHRHLAKITHPQVLVRTGLSLDLDRPPDLQAARNHSLGSWIDEIVS